MSGACYAIPSNLCRGCDGVDVHSSTDEEEEDEEEVAAKPREKVVEKSQADEDSSESEEEEEEGEQESDEEEPGNKDPSKKKRSRTKKLARNSSEKALMVTARVEKIGRTFIAKKTRKGISSSHVWQFFTKIENGLGKVDTVKCKCGEILKWKTGSGTGTLTRHSRGCMTVVYGSSMVVDQDDVVEVSGDNLMQTTLCFDKGTRQLHALPNIPFSQDAGRNAMVEMTAMDDQSFLSSEHIGFRRFCAILRPEFQCVGRMTVQRDVLENFLKSKQFIKSLLHEAGAGMKNLTTDMWSSIVAFGFMCVTVHFINAKWELIHFLLSFTEPPQPHDAEAISTELFAVIQAYDIDMLSTTCDNASVNDAAIRDLIGLMKDHDIAVALAGELTHNRCCGHIFHLIASCCLEMTDEFCHDLRKNVQILKRSPKQRAQFQGILESLDNYEENYKGRALPQMDVCTRWNSTSEMMSTSDPFKVPFALWFERGGKCREIKEAQWRNGALINTILEPLKSATLVLSASKTVTIHLVFPILIDMKCHIDFAYSELSGNGDERAAGAVGDMRAKFNKYFGNMPLIYIFACVLDPSMKLKYLEHVFHEEGQIEEIEANRENFMRVCVEFHRFYKQQKDTAGGADTGGGSAGVRGSAGGGSAGGGAGTLGRATFEKTATSSSKANFLASSQKAAAEAPTWGPMTIQEEVRRYLDEPLSDVDCGPDTDGILKWWKERATTFPILSRIAKDILSVPATSVPAENTFSRSGRVVSPSRCRLAPETIEALMVWGDWLKKRLQYGWKKLICI